jgi:hypothetical protein
MASSAQSAASDPLSPTLRSVVSLSIFLHLFCVAVVLSSNFRRSRLQSELVRIFACYTQLLDFDPQFTPYYHTLGRAIDDDTWLTIDLYAKGEERAADQPLVKSVRLPEGGSNWLGDRRRHFQLARLIALYADPESENDDMTSEIARSVAARVMRETGNHRAVFRCVRRMSQPLELADLNPGFPPDPTAPAYDVQLYEADVWIDEDGKLAAQKRSSAAEVAPRQPSPTTAPKSKAGADSRETPKAPPP